MLQFAIEHLHSIPPTGDTCAEMRGSLLPSSQVRNHNSLIMFQWTSGRLATELSS